MHKVRARLVGLPLLATVIAACSIVGCSGDQTVVVEGDPEVRRKNKENALEKTLYPNGKPAPKAKRR
jgi:hypothetical protein